MWIGNLPYELLIPAFGYFIPDIYAFGTFPAHASSGVVRHLRYRIHWNDNKRVDEVVMQHLEEENTLGKTFFPTTTVG